MFSDDIILSVSNISKCYEIYDKPVHRLYQTLCVGHRQFYREFWALRDISFEVRRGECVGIIGRNGAGKSTLLQIITGTLNPTTGTVERNGKIAALLELGSGFNPEFTGKENVYMNAAILGLSREEIQNRYQKIIDFADIGDFINQPVKTYSSGMMARITFAVNTFIDADILIVDETLSVGDVFFQQKCTSRLKKLLDAGTSLLFVSHSTGAVQQLCSKALFLDKGNLVTFSDTSTAISMYLKESNKPLYNNRKKPEAPKPAPEPIKKDTLDNPYPVFDEGDEVDVPKVIRDEEYFKKKLQGVRYGSGRTLILGVELLDIKGNPKDSFITGDIIVFRMHVEAHEDIQKMCYNLKIVTSHGVGVVHFSSYERGMHDESVKAGEHVIIDFKVRNVFGGSQTYSVHAGLTTLENGDIGEHEILDCIESCNVFQSLNRKDYPVWDMIDIPCLIETTKK